MSDNTIDPQKDEYDIENQETMKQQNQTIQNSNMDNHLQVKLDQQYPQQSQQPYLQSQPQMQNQQILSQNNYQVEQINVMQPNPIVQQQIIRPIIAAELNQYPGALAMGIDSYTRELMAMPGQEKLRNVTKLNIRVDRLEACASDLHCLGPFGKKYTISTQNLFNASFGQPLFEIELEEGGCIQSTMNGSFVNINPQYPELHEKRRELIYEVPYTRSCCFPKYLSIVLSFIFIFIWCFFYVFAAIFPSSSVLKKDGVEIFNLKFKLCNGDIIIQEGKNNLKYILKSRKGNSRALVDQQGNAVQGFQYTNIDGASINVTFPDNFPQDEKAAVIFAVCKSIV